MAIEVTDDSTSIVARDERPALVVQLHSEKASVSEEDARTPQIVALETA